MFDMCTYVQLWEGDIILNQYLPYLLPGAVYNGF